jgi:AraC-like DNA-binding protein
MRDSCVPAVPETFFRYLPASLRDKAWGLYVTTAGYVKIEPGMAYPPLGHPEGYALSWQNGRVLDEYQLHYVPAGGGVLESASSGCSRIETGDFFLLFPETWHRYAPVRQTGWDEFWIGFKGPQMDQLVKAGFFPKACPVYKPQVQHESLDLFSEIFIQLREEPIGFMQVLAAHAIQLLAGMLASSQPHQKDSHAERVIRAARRRLRSELDREIDLHALARELGVSYPWLRQMFRRYTGLPPHQYHIQLRLNKATQLLAVAGCSVKEAAEKIGYTDQYYFSRIFKRKTGRSPEAWKRLVAQRVASRANESVQIPSDPAGVEVDA